MSFLDDLAEAHGVPYRFAAISEGHRSYLIDRTVVLNETLTPERANWAYCHELAHLKLEHPHNPPLNAAEEREQENEANLLASELILPDSQFAGVSHQSLSELKVLFPHASHEVIGRRRLNYRPGLLTIYDNRDMTARLAPDGWSCPTRLFPIEFKALEACSKSRSAVNFSEGNMRIEATFVDEGRGVERVILFMEGEET